MKKEWVMLTVPLENAHMNSLERSYEQSLEMLFHTPIMHQTSHGLYVSARLGIPNFHLLDNVGLLSSFMARISLLLSLFHSVFCFFVCSYTNQGISGKLWKKLKLQILKEAEAASSPRTLNNNVLEDIRIVSTMLPRGYRLVQLEMFLSKVMYNPLSVFLQARFSFNKWSFINFWKNMRIYLWCGSLMNPRNSLLEPTSDRRCIKLATYCQCFSYKFWCTVHEDVYEDGEEFFCMYSLSWRKYGICSHLSFLNFSQEEQLITPFPMFHSHLGF